MAVSHSRATDTQSDWTVWGPVRAHGVTEIRAPSAEKVATATIYREIEMRTWLTFPEKALRGAGC